MKIVIIGAGEVGYQIADKLSKEGHDIVVVEKDRERCQKIEESIDVAVIHGDGASQSTLYEAGAKSADMLIAATSVDEVNLLSCLIASKLGVRRKIARVRNPEYYSESSVLKKEDLGVDLMINPEFEVAEEITRLLIRSVASEIIEFEDGKILMVGLKVDQDAPIINKQLKSLGTENQRKKFRVVAICKNNKTIIPHGDEYISKNDQVFVVTKREGLDELLEMAGKKDSALKKVMILGGGRIGRKVAENLEKRDIKVTLLESDRERSLEVASALKKCTVINLNGAEIDALAREGITNMDALVATTSDDETNIITCLFAKHLGIKKTIALVNKTVYMPLMPVIGIDSTVNVRLSTANAILRFLRKGDVVSVATFHGIDAEAIEIKVGRDSKMVNKPLKELKFPEGSLVAAIIKENEVIVPYGDTVIEPGNRVILFALPHAIHDLEERF
ncbi:MAG: Trk system potassium transporter TrkA [Desulfobacterota bacterium]|nr:Trk system potassium transporter TrkA [Thermodesulfobacteriota bacterium]MDW8001559.1 Trk system potassium transporter TrkA [Deltaproteobacteria bacterium]